MRVPDLGRNLVPDRSTADEEGAIFEQSPSPRAFFAHHRWIISCVSLSPLFERCDNLPREVSH